MQNQYSRFIHRGLTLFVSSLVLFTSVVRAEYPDKPILFVAPFAAGGANDYLTRLMAQHMGMVLKTSIVADNKTGANGIVGASYVAKSAADGYVLLMGNSATHGTNSSLYPNMPYDPIADFAPVSMVGAVPLVIAVDPRLNINSIAELIAYGKTHPGKLSFGSSGVGGTGHLAGEAFNASARLDLVHAPYKGDAPAVADVAAGQVPLAVIGVASASPLYSARKIKVLAVASKVRSKAMPDVPTLTEAGFSGLEFSQWYALVARAGTPKDVIQKLNVAAKQVLKNQDVIQAMLTQGAEAQYTTPEQLENFYQIEIKRFANIIQKLNIKAD